MSLRPIEKPDSFRAWVVFLVLVWLAGLFGVVFLGGCCSMPSVEGLPLGVVDVSELDLDPGCDTLLAISEGSRDPLDGNMSYAKASLRRMEESLRRLEGSRLKPSDLVSLFKARRELMLAATNLGRAEVADHNRREHAAHVARVQAISAERAHIERERSALERENAVLHRESLRSKVGALASARVSFESDHAASVEAQEAVTVRPSLTAAEARARIRRMGGQGVREPSVEEAKKFGPIEKWGRHPRMAALLVRLGEGASASQIAHEFGVTTQTVTNLRKRWRAHFGEACPDGNVARLSGRGTRG